MLKTINLFKLTVTVVAYMGVSHTGGKISTQAPASLDGRAASIRPQVVAAAAPLAEAAAGRRLVGLQKWMLDRELSPEDKFNRLCEYCEDLLKYKQVYIMRDLEEIDKGNTVTIKCLTIEWLYIVMKRMHESVGFKTELQKDPFGNSYVMLHLDETPNHDTLKRRLVKYNGCRGRILYWLSYLVWPFICCCFKYTSIYHEDFGRGEALGVTLVTLAAGSGPDTDSGFGAGPALRGGSAASARSPSGAVFRKRQYAETGPNIEKRGDCNIS